LKEHLEKTPENQDNVRKKDSRGRGFKGSSEKPRIGILEQNP
jgi:hypothetical protein